MQDVDSNRACVGPTEMSHPLCQTELLPPFIFLIEYKLLGEEPKEINASTKKYYLTI